MTERPPANKVCYMLTHARAQSLCLVNVSHLTSEATQRSEHPLHRDNKASKKHVRQVAATNDQQHSSGTWSSTTTRLEHQKSILPFPTTKLRQVPERDRRMKPNKMKSSRSTCMRAFSCFRAHEHKQRRHREECEATSLQLAKFPTIMMFGWETKRDQDVTD